MTAAPLIFTPDLPNLLRAVRGRHAFELVAHVGNTGRTERFEARVRWKHSGRIITTRSFTTSRPARTWLMTQADRDIAAIIKTGLQQRGLRLGGVR